MNKDEKVLFDKVEDAMNSFEGRPLEIPRHFYCY